MCKTGKSIYQESRKQAGLSQESAAVILNVSIESIGAYERGETRIPCELVAKMALIYGDETLCYRHMTTRCPVGEQCLPAFEQEETAVATVHLLKEHGDVADLERQLIASAGTNSRLQTGMKEIWELAGACMSYMFSGKKRTTGVAITSGSARQKRLERV